jgi:small-conductance mechanosensitive channel
MRRAMTAVASVACVARRRARPGSRPRPPPIGGSVTEAIAGPPIVARVAALVVRVATLLVVLVRLVVLLVVRVLALVVLLVLVLVRVVARPLGRAVGENRGAGNDVRARGQRGGRALLVLVRDETESLRTLTGAIKDDDDLGQLAKAAKVINELVCNGNDKGD